MGTGQITAARRTGATSRRALSAASAGLGLLASLGGVAQAQTLRSVPLGGRTATMGGAGVAFGNDSAMPFLNPAGLAGLPTDVLGLSGTVYGASRVSGRALLSPSGRSAIYGPAVDAGTEVTSTATFEMPSAILYGRHIGDDRHQVLAMSLTTPTALKRALVVNGSTLYPQRQGSELETFSYQHDRRDYYLGPSYALEVSRALRIGVSAFAVYSDSTLSSSRTITQSYRGGIQGVSSFNGYSERATAWSATAVAGLQLAPVEGLWLGLSVEAPSQHMGGKLEGNQSYGSVVTRSGNTGAATTDAAYQGRFQAVRPGRVTAGIGYQRPRSFAVALDATVTFGRSRAERQDLVFRYAERQTGEINRSHAQRVSIARGYDTSIDVAGGGELYVLDWLAVRAGAFVDRSALRAPPGSPQIEVEELTYWGLSAGLGALLGSFDLTVGAQYRRGTGEFITQGYNGSQPLFNALIGLGARPDTARASFSDDMLLLLVQGVIGLGEARDKIQQSVPVKALPVQGVLP